jgi:signal transduction histidine kinase
MYTDAGTIDLIIDSNRLIVQDSGIGMEVDDKGQAFKPYFRGSNSRRGGHGVGLSIVKKLSDRFSWQVDLTSEIGVGTTATLHMPQANYFLLETPLTFAPISS